MLRAVTLKQLAEGMISAVRRELVLDETGIPGVFDVDMSWRPEASTDPDDARPAFVTAMQEQLGLKLEPTRRQIEVLVIHSIERPDARLTSCPALAGPDYGCASRNPNVNSDVPAMMLTYCLPFTA